MNSAAEAKGFQCPNGFVKEDVASQLYLEDLDDDSELWLVRIPSHVDPSVLEKQEIDLNKGLNTLYSDNKSYECISEKCEMPNLSLVLPQKENKRLTRVNKSIEGSVFLYEMEDQPDIKVEEDNDEPRDIFIKPKSKKQKENHAESDLSSAMDSINEDSECLSSKKKSKKKKSSFKAEPSSE